MSTIKRTVRDLIWDVSWGHDKLETARKGVTEAEATLAKAKGQLKSILQSFPPGTVISEYSSCVRLNAEGEVEILKTISGYDLAIPEDPAEDDEQERQNMAAVAEHDVSFEDCGHDLAAHEPALDAKPTEIAPTDDPPLGRIHIFNKPTPVASPPAEGRDVEETVVRKDSWANGMREHCIAEAAHASTDC